MKLRLLFLLGLVIQAWATEQTVFLSDDIAYVIPTVDPSLQFDTTQQEYKSMNIEFAGISQIQLSEKIVDNDSVTHAVNTEGQASLTIYAPHKKKHETVSQQQEQPQQNQIAAPEETQTVSQPDTQMTQDIVSEVVSDPTQVAEEKSTVDTQVVVQSLEPTVEPVQQVVTNDVVEQVNTDITQVSSDPTLVLQQVVTSDDKQVIDPEQLNTDLTTLDPTLVDDSKVDTTQEVQIPEDNKEVTQEQDLIPHFVVGDNGESSVVYAVDPTLQQNVVAQDQIEKEEPKLQENINSKDQTLITQKVEEIQNTIIVADTKDNEVDISNLILTKPVVEPIINQKEVDQQQQVQPVAQEQQLVQPEQQEVQPQQQEVQPEQQEVQPVVQEQQLVQPVIQDQQQVQPVVQQQINDPSLQYKQVIDPSLQVENQVTENPSKEQVQQIEVTISRLQETLESAKEEKEKQEKMTPEERQEKKIQKQMEKEQEELRQKIQNQKEDEERRKQAEIEESIRQEAEIQQQLQKEEQVKMAQAQKKAEEQKLKEAIQRETEEAIMKDQIAKKEDDNNKLAETISQKEQKYKQENPKQEYLENSESIMKEEAKKEFNEKKDEILAILHKQKMKENLLKDNDLNTEKSHKRESLPEPQTSKTHKEEKPQVEQRSQEPIIDVKKEVEPFEKLFFEKEIEMEENDQDDFFQKDEKLPLDQSEKKIFEEKVKVESIEDGQLSLDEELEKERLDMKQRIEQEEKLESIIQESENSFINEVKNDFPEPQYKQEMEKPVKPQIEEQTFTNFWQQENQKRAEIHPSDVIAKKLTQFKNQNIQKEDFMMLQELIDKDPSINEQKIEKSEQEVINHLKMQRQKKLQREQEKALKAQKEEEEIMNQLKQQQLNSSPNDSVIEELLDNVYLKKNQGPVWEPPNKKLIEQEIKEFLKSQQLDIPDLGVKTKSSTEEEQVFVEMTEEQKKKIFEEYLQEKKKRKEEIFKQLQQKYNQKDSHIAEIQTKEKPADTNEILNYEFELAYQDWYSKNQPKNNTPNQEKEQAHISRLRGQMNHKSKK